MIKVNDIITVLPPYDVLGGVGVVAHLYDTVGFLTARIHYFDTDVEGWDVLPQHALKLHLPK